MRGVRRAAHALTVALGLCLLAPAASCGSTPADRHTAAPAAAPAAPSAAKATGTTGQTTAGRGVAARYRAARSTPHTDSVYPRYGTRVVDALHYGLTLTWKPAAKELAGRERLVLRVAHDADAITLDLSHALVVHHVTVNGHPTAHAAVGNHKLRIARAVKTGQILTVALTYSGRPHPAPAPTRRSDVPGVGFTPVKGGGAWTQQEPYGAFTWYAVNDEPADKAFYDFTLRVPAPMVGVANGRMTSRTTADGIRTTRFHLTRPASSYLTTVAFGRYDRHALGTVDGIPVVSWTLHGNAYAVKRSAVLPRLLRWAIRRMGPYPFPTLNMIVVPGDSGMETQETLTMGSTRYDLEDDTLVHEIVHQWYGDTVTPYDWRDVWMSEGMALYVQTVYDDVRNGLAEGTTLGQWTAYDNSYRRDYGPPGDYDPRDFAENNVYAPPAKMWDTLRRQLGDTTFWKLVRAWPTSHAYTASDRATLADWWSDQTGTDLHPFFRRWIMGATDPA